MNPEHIYECGGRLFPTIATARVYASFIFKISGYVIAITEVRSKE